MNEDINKSVETAKKILNDGSCGLVGCLHDRCPADSSHTCQIRPLNKGYNGTKFYTEEAKNFFRDYLAQHENTGAEAPTKAKCNKPTKIRRVEVELDGVVYKAGFIGGSLIVAHFERITALEKKRDELNKQIRELNTQAKRYTRMVENGELD